MLTELFAHPKLAGLWRIMLWIYGTASLLLIFRPDGSLAAWIFSWEGVRQGCVFGSFGFSIATLRLVVQLKVKHPSVLVVAIIDDVTLSGPPKQVCDAFVLFIELCRQYGLIVQNEKCKLLVPTSGVSQELSSFAGAHDLVLEEGCVPLLGTVVGRRIQESCLGCRQGCVVGWPTAPCQHPCPQRTNSPATYATAEHSLDLPCPRWHP